MTHLHPFILALIVTVFVPAKCGLIPREGVGVVMVAVRAAPKDPWHTGTVRDTSLFDENTTLFRLGSGALVPFRGQSPTATRTSTLTTTTFDATKYHRDTDVLPFLYDSVDDNSTAYNQFMKDDLSMDFSHPDDNQ